MAEVCGSLHLGDLSARLPDELHSLSEGVISLGAQSFADVLFGKKHHFSTLDKKAFPVFDLKGLISRGRKRESALPCFKK